MFKNYLEILKPKIVLSNSISATSGFLLASHGQNNYSLLIFTLVSISLIIASGCIFNNIIDRDIDEKMKRTKNRVLVKNIISRKNALIYAAIMGISGFTLLYLVASILSILLAVVGYVIYVVIYSLYMKRKSIYATLVGSISGAMPPVIGYCSVINKFDIGAVILLLIFSLWQIPHFYAIAIFYLKDYKAASLPILPVKLGVSTTKHYITICIVGFILATTLLILNGYVGYSYLIVTTIVNLLWLITALYGYQSINNNKIWAKRLFILSIITLVSLSLMISIDFTTPVLYN